MTRKFALRSTTRISSKIGSRVAPYNLAVNLYKEEFNRRSMALIRKIYGTCLRDHYALVFDGHSRRTCAALIAAGVPKSHIIIIERDAATCEMHRSAGFICEQGNAVDLVPVMRRIMDAYNIPAFTLLMLDLNGQPRANFTFVRLLIEHGLIDMQCNFFALTLNRRIRGGGSYTKALKREIRTTNVILKRNFGIGFNKIAEYCYGNPVYKQANMETIFFQFA
jgi:predicted DNA-binding protein